MNDTSHIHQAPGTMRRTGKLQAIGDSSKPRFRPVTKGKAKLTTTRLQPVFGKRAWPGFESKPIQRPGAEDHRQHPSLIGGKRVWPDGRVEVAC